MSELVLDGRVAPANYWNKTINANYVKEWLNKNSGDITVKINTYGGDAYEGIDIYNLLRGYANNKGKVTTVAMSKCMSIGTLILFAGDKRHAHKNSTIMCHKAWTVSYGNSEEMEKQKNILDGIDDILAEEYKKATPNLSIEEIKNKMSKEMWYIGKKQLLNSGFISKIIKNETLDPIDNPKNSYGSFFAEYKQKAIEMKSSVNYANLEKVLNESKDKCKHQIIKGDKVNKAEFKKLQANYIKAQKTIKALNKEVKTLKKDYKAEIEARNKLFNTVLATGKYFKLDSEKLQANFDKATDELLTNKVYTDSYVEHIVNEIVLEGVETEGSNYQGSFDLNKKQDNGEKAIENWKKRKKEGRA